MWIVLTQTVTESSDLFFFFGMKKTVDSHIVVCLAHFVPCAHLTIFPENTMIPLMDDSEDSRIPFKVHHDFVEAFNKIDNCN